MRVGQETRKERSQFGEAINDCQSPNTAGHVSVSTGWRWARRSWMRQRWRPQWPRPRRSRRPRSSMSRPRTTKSHRPRSKHWIWIWWTDRIRGFRPMVSNYSIVPIFNLRTRIYGLMVRTVTISLSITA